MAELILQSDPLEFQNSRQSTKIMFLQQELQQLQEHVKDLERVVRINKEALRIATGQLTPVLKNKPTSPLNDKTSSINENNSTAEQTKIFQSLIEHLQEENMKLLDIIEKVKQERNIAQSKALISEQICEESQRHEGEAVAELEEKISDLRKLLQDKEYAIQELEKLKAIPEQDGVVIKYREVLNPTEQSLKLHNECDALNSMLSKVSKELNKLQAEKQQLQSLNFSLTNELAKIRATFSSPLNAPYKFGMLGQMNSETDLNNSDGGVFQPVMEMDENSPLPSPLPNKVQNQDFNQPKASVPKLDLSKAKQIQEQIAKKITVQQAPVNNENYNPKYVEKIHHLEDELTMAKKRLSHEMINNKLLSDEIAVIQRQTMHLASTNELLIRSNKRYEEKWQKIFYTLEFYRGFYYKYIDLITKGRTHMKTASTYAPKLDNLIKMKEKLDFDLDQAPDKLIRDLKRIDEENGNQIDISILEAGELDTDGNSVSNIPREKSGINEFNKEQCKAYLLNIAKDLYINTNLSKTAIARQMLKKLGNKDDQSQPVATLKLKRAVSNPLEYVSERKKFIFDTNLTKKSKKGLKLKHDRGQQNGENGAFVDDRGDLSPIDHKAEDQIGFGGNKANKKGKNEYDGDEMISFTVDAEEFNKNKLVEVSFISNNDILDHIKQDI